MSPAPRATVVITTKNRRDELRVAVRSALAQSVPVEVLVIDDGSTDGTSDMIRGEFPAVRLERRDTSAGLIVRRNEGTRLASSPIIFSIDDDAEFVSTQTVEQTLRDFDDPRIGAVAIPFINVKQDASVRQRAPGDGRVYVAAWYIGTAHALRRDLFLGLGGYRACLIHQGEEGDYCVRMLASGHFTRVGTADPIHHYESPRRDMRRMDFYGRRNDILFAWFNVPMPHAIVHMVGTTLNGLRLAVRIRRPWHMVKGLVFGWAACVKYWGERRPVEARVYKLYRRLKKSHMRPLSEIEAELPRGGEAVETH